MTMFSTLYLYDHINSCMVSILACVFLTVSFVASLYVWRSNLSRDHPSTIKRRFFGVSCMMLLAPFFSLSFLTESTLQRGDVYDQLGLRSTGVIQASIYPLILTMVLFLGPLTMHIMSGVWKLYTGLRRIILGILGLPVLPISEVQNIHLLLPVLSLLYTEPVYWLSSWQDLVWVRNHFMAPLSEEWVFRACMMPLMLQCYEPQRAIFIGPLLFGIAHLHHMIELMRMGTDVKIALITSTFQFTYTSVFGAYSSYLFARTGHFVAPLVAHMFCNHMGFPNFGEIGEYPIKQRAIIMFNFVLGLVLWYFLLSPLTSPDIYDNRLFWTPA